MATLTGVVVLGAILFVAGFPGRLAVVRDDRMEPTVPQGSVMILADDQLHVGDVVAWWPNGTRNRTRHLGALFAIFDDTRPGRRVLNQAGDARITFDNRPDEAPVVVKSPGRVHGPMVGYIPFVGYLLWPGPLALLGIVMAAIVVLVLTGRSPSQ